MARWKLTEPHYLNVPGTKWELTMQNRTTGKPQRKVFEVPLYLNPEDEGDWNVREGFDGYVAVCHEGKGNPSDIVFLGDPTPGMVPLDEEARALTAKFAWTPTQGTDEESKMASFGNQLLNGLIDQMSDVQTRASAAQSVQGMDQLIAVMTQMMAQQGELITRLAGPDIGAEQKAHLHDAERIPSAQVINEEEPLDEAEPTQEEIEEASKAAVVREKASQEKALNRMSSRRI